MVKATPAFIQGIISLKRGQERAILNGKRYKNMLKKRVTDLIKIKSETDVTYVTFRKKSCCLFYCKNR